MKANFKISESKYTNNQKNNVADQKNNTSTDFSQVDYEEYVLKSGASGSFMIFRSAKKDEELGLDEL